MVSAGVLKGHARTHGAWAAPGLFGIALMGIFGRLCSDGFLIITKQFVILLPQSSIVNARAVCIHVSSRSDLHNTVFK